MLLLITIAIIFGSWLAVILCLHKNINSNPHNTVFDILHICFDYEWNKQKLPTIVKMHSKYYEHTLNSK